MLISCHSSDITVPSASASAAPVVTVLRRHANIMQPIICTLALLSVYDIIII